LHPIKNQILLVRPDNLLYWRKGHNYYQQAEADGSPGELRECPQLSLSVPGTPAAPRYAKRIEIKIDYLTAGMI